MARLLTDHDPFHVHALLGLLVLLHFIYRWALLLSRGSSFPLDEPVGRQLAGCALHVLLPVASLLLPVPAKRALTKPMIWREYRMHALLFGSRHAVGAMVALAARAAGLERTRTTAVALQLVHHATMWGATIATSRLGDTEVRTTNATPYPSHVPEAEVEATRSSYGSAQFYASALLLSADPTLCFLPILPIQLMAFAMTLVRKNLMSPTGAHVLYAWALLSNFAGGLMLIWLQAPNDTAWRHILAALVAWRIALILRWKLRWDKHVTWVIAAAAGYGARELANSRFPPVQPPVAHPAGDVAAVCVLVLASCRFFWTSPNVIWGTLAGGKGPAKEEPAEPNGHSAANGHEHSS